VHVPSEQSVEQKEMFFFEKKEPKNVCRLGSAQGDSGEE
jgi:hypothetical protein